METTETLQRSISDKTAERLERFRKQGDLLAHRTKIYNLPRISLEGLLTHQLAGRIKRPLPTGRGHPVKEDMVSVTDLWAQGSPPDYSHFSKLTPLEILIVLDSSVRSKIIKNYRVALDPGELAIGKRVKPDEILGIVVSRDNWDLYRKPLNEFIQTLDDDQKEIVDFVDLSSYNNIQDWLIDLCQSTQTPLYKAVETAHPIYDGQKGINFEVLWPKKEAS